ncbi:MAG: Ig-like domain-containing protein [Candidatus Pseudobacter hemicellulosilyticus]|uniref:Ig-like domain-containing protein n=1 Tax=Candidatus Pseudobacter hemicellulosilyticus TaxID=3121375 RepID=A0AAJ5WQU2_9BACT|nr:MAG: Ig-like domain-containing protein [Pseudobacter sp.]
MQKLYLRTCFLCLCLLALTAGRSTAQNWVNLALNKPGFASTSTVYRPDGAFDGNYGTRWESYFSDPEWLYVDLGASYPINRVKLFWEAAYGRDFQIQVSEDAQNWVAIATITNNTDVNNDLTGLSGQGRYVRMYGTVRGTGFGYSLYEFEVYSVPDPPVVSITSPENNASYAMTTPVTVTVDATAQAGKSISRVELYYGDLLLGVDETAPYSFTGNGPGEGNYALRAKAIDNAGAVSFSAPIHIIINNLSTGDCSGAPEWDSLTIYPNAGAKVTYLGRLYENRYYTTRQNPVRNSGQYEVWKLLSTCGTGTVVTVTLPDSNHTFNAPASINIHVDALANENYRITKVEVYNNGTQLIDTDTSANFSFDWNDLPAGNYSITAVATDNTGATTSSYAIPITVVNGTGCNAPEWRSQFVYANAGEQVTWQGALYQNKWYTQGQNPASNSGEYQVWTLISTCPTGNTITLTAPPNNASYGAPATIPINASLTGPAVVKVEFYQGPAVLGVDSTAPYSYNWAGVSAGHYTISARAFNSTEAVAVSSDITVTVTPQETHFTWTGNGGNSNWNDPANWQPTAVPGVSDSVVIGPTTFAPQLQGNTLVADLTLQGNTLDLNGQQLTLTGHVQFNGGSVNNGTLTIQCSEVLYAGTSFGANVNLTTTCGNIYFNGSVFNGPVLITKQGSGAMDNDGTGGSIFNGPATIVNNTTARLRMGGSLPDDFNAAIVFNNNSTGAFEISYNSNSTFSGAITVNSNTSPSFGSGGGTPVLDGTGLQTINRTGVAPVLFNRLELNKPTGNAQLNTPVTIGAFLQLTKADLLTDMTNQLIFAPGATVSGANDSSFVAGPVTRYGDGAFTFPIGRDTLYRPIGINPEGASPTDAFLADYFPAGTSQDPAPKESSIHHISTCEYWILNRVTGSANTAVTLSWDKNSCGVTNPGSLLVARWDGSQWTNAGNGGFTGTTEKGTLTSSEVITSFSPFTLGSSTAANPLPVNLLSFTATGQNSKVLLQWSTAREWNNKGFELQRSGDGLHFSAIGFVDGAGNSEQQQDYQFTDQQPLTGVSWYRLKQLDLDNTATLSRIVAVDLAANAGFRVLPNPTTGLVTLLLNSSSLEAGTVLDLHDQTGRLLQSRQIGNRVGSITLDLSAYPKGIYLLSLRAAGKLLFQSKLIKQ